MEQNVSTWYRIYLKTTKEIGNTKEMANINKGWNKMYPQGVSKNHKKIGNTNKVCNKIYLQGVIKSGISGFSAYEEIFFYKTIIFFFFSEKRDNVSCTSTNFIRSRK